MSIAQRGLDVENRNKELHDLDQSTSSPLPFPPSPADPTPSCTKSWAKPSFRVLLTAGGHFCPDCQELRLWRGMPRRIGTVEIKLECWRERKAELGARRGLGLGNGDASSPSAACFPFLPNLMRVALALGAATRLALSSKTHTNSPKTSPVSNGLPRFHLVLLVLAGCKLHLQAKQKPSILSAAQTQLRSCAIPFFIPLLFCWLRNSFMHNGSSDMWAGRPSPAAFDLRCL